ncbi:TonB-dependent receptor [Pseudoteredinibacter isoporae]|uniref:Hemoglobin/transferrin/lactoferrin receptor protein n=1 Tax=Pseudoteredinibacter isoporae TaxID=570281 RepID=A0A7X0JYK0_9GAMM|nr:TonB-dependent receptor [Pseudoteredinibacter isoporae]MBB6523626.1 hemoglobin/transferrin/lactoferrin receptor protein [Pseudoteredinibacter isoporae]NHO89133.1 TonB-dependent receptor [Pseudoteredinibacter isoporae]NIB22256.1 TonB-dependent receptor [Pseudoteredinibacter isoporae]
MKSNFQKKSLAVFIAAASGSVFGIAAQAEDKKADQPLLETIVVVGEATNALITTQELEAYQANDLEDVFKLTPSISVGGGASGITQKVYVRGLEDALINVTVDGSPQTSTLFHHIGRVTIDPDLLKEVEVQSGAGEATSGAGAIGGSIRFKTKDANDLLAEGESFGGKVKAGYFSNDGHQYSASLYGRLTDTWGVLAYHSNTDRDSAEAGDGTVLPGSQAEQTLNFFKVSGEINDNQHLSLSYEERDEEGAFPRQPNWAPAQTAPLYTGKGERQTFAANYTLTGEELLNLEVSAYHTQSSFQRELFTYKTEITSYGFDIRNTSELGAHRFTYGVDLREDEVESGLIAEPVSANEEGRVLGAYVQVHSQVTDDLLLSYGARFDDYEFEQKLPNRFGNPLQDFDSSDVSLNAGFEYKFNDEWQISAGYAEATRGKEIGDGFTIDSAFTPADLKAESVKNIETAIEYTTPDLYAKVAVFRSEIDDVIYDQLGGARTQPILFENIGTVETDGYELEVAYRFNDDLEAKLGFSSVDAVLDPAADLFSIPRGKIDLMGYEYNGLGNSRGDTWNLNLNYAISSTVKIGWNYSRVEDLNNIEVLQRAVQLGWIGSVQTVDKPGYDIHDFYAEWTPSKNLKLNLAIINAFDEDYRDHSSVADYSHIPGWGVVNGYKEPGQDVRASLTFSF